jgi:hypothetical protein
VAKKRRKKAAGCYPQCHYQYSREYVDFDYVDQLNDDEAEWLANFADNYYSGRFKKDDDKNPIKEKREGYNRASHQRFDVMSGRSRSRVLLDKDGAKFIEVLDVGAFKRYIEDNKVGDGEDED